MFILIFLYVLRVKTKIRTESVDRDSLSHMLLHRTLEDTSSSQFLKMDFSQFDKVAVFHFQLHIYIYILITEHEEQCGMNEFRCRNNMCISSAYACDGQNDCRDNSDEEHCGK